MSSFFANLSSPLPFSRGSSASSPSVVPDEGVNLGASLGPGSTRPSDDVPGGVMGVW